MGKHAGSWPAGEWTRTQLTRAGRLSTVRRSMAAAIAGIFLFGHLWGLFHFALVWHTSCLEHGETIHARVPPAGFAQSHVPVARGEPGHDRSIASRTFSPSANAHAHDHCDVVPPLRERFTPTAGFTGHIWFSDRGTKVAFVDSGATRATLSLYRLAPKNSPPSV